MKNLSLLSPKITDNQSIGRRSNPLLILVLVTLLSFFNSNLFATHFRYGLITATRISETATTVNYRLNVSLAWRIGAAPTSASFTISGGNSGTVNVNLSNVNDPTGSWTNSSGIATVTLNKTTNPTRVTFTSCCKISDLSNNHDSNWDVYTILRTNLPGSTPVSTMPAIINMPINASHAVYTIPASDPDAGSTLTYGIPNFSSGNLAGETEPAGFSVNSPVGQIVVNTVGKTIGQLENAMVTVTDNQGNQIMLDFLINYVGESTPPQFDYSVTPLNGNVYNVIAGQNISFPIKAADSDAGSTVSLSISGLPSYITNSNFNPALPVSGNPAQTAFSWTPAAAQIGSTVVLNFIATDNVGVQTTSSVTIKVVAEPAPVFIAPTPTANSIRQIETSQLYTQDIVAQSSLGSNVSIAYANGIPSGASLTPAVPTAGANPGQTQINWIPTSADFGIYTFNFQAVISAIPSIFTSTNFQLIVNTPPQFSSTPNLVAVEGAVYSYTVTINDPDIAYGDTVEVVGTTIPSWLTLVSIGNGVAVLQGTPSYSDIGTHHVLFEAEDIYHHGNPSEVEQEFDIIVNPAIVASNNSPVYAGDSLKLYVTAGDTYSWVGPNGFTSSLQNPVIANVPLAAAGDYTVSVTINGYTSTATTSATILCSPATFINCQSDIVENTPANSCTSFVVYDVTTGGNPLSTATYTLQGATSGSDIVTSNSLQFNIGTTLVKMSVTNSCGTDTCAFVVNINDVTPAVVSTNDITIDLDASGNASITVAQIDNGSNDACGITTLTLDKTTFNCSNVGQNTVTLTATDVNGNVSSNTAVVTINDVTPAVVSTNDITIDLDASGNASITVAQIDNGSNDACGITTLTLDKTTFNCSNVGLNTVTLTATDVNGNVSSNTAVVTINDVTPAVVSTNDITIDLDASGNASITVAQIDNGSNDACGIATLTLDKTTFNCSNVGQNTVTLTATDVNGNVSSNTAVVTINDVTPAVVSTNDITIDLDASGNASITLAQIDNGSNDACGITTLTLDKTTFNCSNVGQNTVTLTATDVNGNVSSNTAAVTINDVTPAVVSTNDITIDLDASGNASITLAQIDNGSNDACGTATLTLDKTTFNCSNVGLNTVTLTATDVNGNVSSNTAVVTVKDNVAPTAVCKNISVTLNSSGNATIVASDVDGGSTDACGIKTLSVDKSLFTCSNIGSNNVVLTVTDNNGNSSHCTATVNVIGAIPSVTISNGVQGAFCQGGAVVLTANAPTAVSYAWSNGSFGSTNNVYASGVYSVTVTNAYGCKSSTNTSVSYNQSSLTSAYGIIGLNQVALNTGSKVLSGGVGVSNPAGMTAVNGGSSVTGSGTFVKSIFINDFGGTVSTKIYAPTFVSLPGFLGNPYILGFNKFVAPGSVVTITDSIFGSLTIGANTKVTFTSRNIYAANIAFGDNVTVEFATCANVRVTGPIFIGVNDRINTLNPKSVVFYTSNNVAVAQNSTVRASIYAIGMIQTNGGAFGQQPVNMQGLYIANSILTNNTVFKADNICGSCSNVVASRSASDDDQSEEPIITNFASAENSLSAYPNPFYNKTTIAFVAVTDSKTSIDLYDVNGALVQNLFDEQTQKGKTYKVELDAQNLESAIYYVRLTTSEKTETIKVVLVK